MVIYTCNPSYSGEGTEEGRGERGEKKKGRRQNVTCLFGWFNIVFLALLIF
jgi:hypothetical protein